MGKDANTRAVVLGGSLGGLFAARVLADAYDEVVVVDRDLLVGVSEPRRGCPQGRHISGLLTRGQRAVESMYPGITAELFADGVPDGDLAGTVRWYARGRRLKQQNADMLCVGASRPMLEYHVRNRTQALGNVTFLERHDILGLTTSPDRSKVTGVRVQNQLGEGVEETLDADLVVDASGRGSRTPVWLEDLGYPRVKEERKKIGLGYVTQHYRLRTDPFDGDLSINGIAWAKNPRGVIFSRTDGTRVEMTVYGVLGDHPPTDQAGLYEFVKSLGIPEIYDAVIQAEPLDEPVAFRFPTTLRRRYEDMDRFPDGLLVVGDAVTTFNPIYAGGMTVAALSALTIREHLHSGAAPVPLDYFKDLARNVIDPPWAVTNAADLSFPGVEGDRPLSLKVEQTIMALVQTAASKDSRVTAGYMRVAGQVEHPSTLMKPKYVLRVALALLGLSKHTAIPFRGQNVQPAAEPTRVPTA
ncbi:FAD-dependent monooxygenase [Sphaerisporangium sp. TRM90804]|uniref:FAD-dependent oxidoreductase n=1 Tax=Sphaerisporangium sp. TRM90804 TaxID=3031113 RepID=UPI00244BBC0B|nr:FAD-dependent monooxygenase [Sphaerisporangium sp. TRM90804]MDH2424486.1 FAD-dependent monooxygenase [Sphaerisporangium sp. TRM90804]